MLQEEIIFQLISYAGDAKSLAFKAFEYINDKDYAKAVEAMENSKKELTKAHNLQTELLQKEAIGEHSDVSLLMVHAQDHLMTAMLAKDLIEKIIVLQKEINELKSR